MNDECTKNEMNKSSNFFAKRDSKLTFIKLFYKEVMLNSERTFIFKGHIF